MKTIKQKVLAAYLGISPQLLSDIKSERKTLGKKSAFRVHGKTGIHIDFLLRENGESFLKKVRSSFVASQQAIKTLTKNNAHE